jgi:hypothetical protein
LLSMHARESCTLMYTSPAQKRHARRIRNTPELKHFELGSRPNHVAWRGWLRYPLHLAALTNVSTAATLQNFVKGVFGRTMRCNPVWSSPSIVQRHPPRQRVRPIAFNTGLSLPTRAQISATPIQGHYFCPHVLKLKRVQRKSTMTTKHQQCIPMLRSGRVNRDRVSPSTRCCGCR